MPTYPATPKDEGRAWHVPWTNEEDAIFFEAIADGEKIEDAAKLVGKSKGSGVGRFARVRAKYGWQAQ